MFENKINEIQYRLGGKIATDPYPYPTLDRNMWLELLTKSQSKSIGMYGCLVKIRAIGATLEPNDKFGYIIKPIIRGVDGNKWGWPSEEMYQNEKKSLIPYLTVLKDLLKEIKK